jgi:hypothetical protein
MTLVHPKVIAFMSLPFIVAACGDEKTGQSDAADTVLVTDGVVIDTVDVYTPGPCDPVYQTGCTATENCTYVAAETTPRCFPRGPVPPTEACTAENRCELGLCIAINRTADLCYQFCYGDEDCGEEGRCLGLSGAPYKVCRIPGIYEVCDLVEQGCTDDEVAQRSCYAVLGEDTPICLPTGTVEAGATCGTAGACREGYACVNNACRAVCDLTAETPCGELATCRDLAHGAGFCEPN